MIVFSDKRCIEHVQQVMGITPGFDIVYGRGAYVLDVDVNDRGQKPENNSGIAFSRHTHRTLGESFEPSTADT